MCLLGPLSVHDVGMASLFVLLSWVAFSRKTSGAFQFTGLSIYRANVHTINAEWSWAGRQVSTEYTEQSCPVDVALQLPLVSNSDRSEWAWTIRRVNQPKNCSNTVTARRHSCAFKNACVEPPSGPPPSPRWAPLQFLELPTQLSLGCYLLCPPCIPRAEGPWFAVREKRIPAESCNNYCATAH